MRVLPVVAMLILFLSGDVSGDEIRIAVASSFAGAIESLADSFVSDGTHEVALAFGSTGKHYAQITNGAPFDLFFAADEERPLKLEESGIAIPGSRFTYAIGRLVLWSPDSNLVDSSASVLASNDFRFIAIANPKLAPYGVAAEQVMRSLGVWDSLRRRTVRGENIGHAFQFVVSGNAELGFVARSQVRGRVEGSTWEVPQRLYSPIAQQAVLLRENRGARDFISFVKSEAGRMIIQRFGYETP